MEQRALRRISWSVVLVAVLDACGTPPGDADASGSSGEASTSAAPTDSAGTSTPITATSTSLGSDTSAAASSDTSAADSSGAPLPPACLPPEAHGAALPELSIPGLNVYEGCDPETWVVEHLGSELQTTVAEINAIREQGTLFPGSPPGLFAVGTGLCCGNLDIACIHIYVERWTDLPGLMAYIDDSFPDDLDACFGLEIAIGEPPVPG
jgi:hypothetical protein